MTTCPVERCNRPANPGWAICKTCASDLEKSLAELPALAEHLNVTLTRQVGRGIGNGSRSAEKPLPYDARASEATWVLRNTLIGWIRDLETRPEHHPHDSPAAMSRWLLGRLGALVVHPAAEQVVEEITGATRNAWSAVDTPPEHVFLGVCPTCRAEDVHAAPGATKTACRGCGAQHDVEALRTALRAALDDHLVTAAEYAGMLTVLGIPIDRERTRTLVNTWAARGRVTVHAGPRYRFGELQARMSTTRQGRR